MQDRDHRANQVKRPFIVHSDAISAAEIAKRCLRIPPTVIAERGGAHVVSQAEAAATRVSETRVPSHGLTRRL
jgi:hypothetical protein